MVLIAYQVQETPSFLAQLHTKKRDHFTKTGSGETDVGKVEKKGDAFSRMQPKDFITLCGVLGTEGWLEHELFSSSSRRSRNFDAFCAALEGELCKRGRDEWVEIFLEAVRKTDPSFFEFSLCFVPSLSWQNDHFCT
jgi:crotonobetainyl-CoA:carnitine CoA-transferase CaiB-like acyl-CoA transferase